MTAHELKHLLPFFDLPFIEEILAASSIMDIPEGAEIIKQNGYTPGVPIVLEGIVKVSAAYEERSMLLYYIQPGESCIMSFSSCLKGKPSEIFATTETAAKIILLPIDKIQHWLATYPSFNTLFYNQFDGRYKELLSNIKELVLHKIDQRLYEYLIEKKQKHSGEYIKITHQQMADDLGTVREVISRTLKKLHTNGKIASQRNGIKIL